MDKLRRFQRNLERSMFWYVVWLLIAAYFYHHWRQAGKRVDAENERIARELAAFDRAIEEGKEYRRREKAKAAAKAEARRREREAYAAIGQEPPPRMPWSY